MEVRLLDSMDVPPGALLSIKARSTRRQGLAEKGKLRLRFEKPWVRGEPVVVELLEVVGQTCVDLSDEGTDARHSVCFAKAKCNVVLGVSKLGDPASCPVAGVVAPSLLENVDGDDGRGGNRRHMTAMSSRTYLDKHKLLAWSQALFNDLIRDEPASPWDYVEEHLRAVRNIEEKMPWKRRIQVASVALHKSCAGVDQLADDLGAEILEAYRPSLDAFSKKISQATMDLFSDLDSMESEMMQKTSKAFNASQNAKEVEVEKVKTHAKSLPQSVEDPPSTPAHRACDEDTAAKLRSKLESIGPSTSQTSHTAAVENLFEMAVSDHREDSEKKPSTVFVGLPSEEPPAMQVQDEETLDDIEILGEATCQPLSETNEGAALEQALRSTEVERGTERGGYLQPTPLGEVALSSDCDFDVFRQVVRQALISGMKDGKLEQALCAIQESPAFASEQALGASNTSDGIQNEGPSTDGVVMTPTMLSTEALPQMVCLTLMQQSEEGKLEEALPFNKTQHETKCATEETKLALADSVEGANKDVDSTSDEELRRQRACQILTQGSQDCRLEQFLRASRATDGEDQPGKLTGILPGANATEMVCKSATDHDYDLDIATLRRKASATLTEALIDRRLLVAIQRSRSELTEETGGVLFSVDRENDEFETLRWMARQTLLRASTDGRLQQALSDCKRENLDEKVEGGSVSETFVLALADGGVERAVAQSKGSIPLVDQIDVQQRIGAFDEIEALRGIVSQALLEASVDGRLEKAVARAVKKTETSGDSGNLCEYDTDAMRISAATQLLEACVDGSLFLAIQQGKFESTLGIDNPATNSSHPAEVGEDELERLRRFARRTLLEGCRDGRLEGAFCKSRGRNFNTSRDGTDTIMRDIRAQDLLSASEDRGPVAKPDSAVADLSERLPDGSCDELEVLRQMASKTLLDGCRDGRLSKVLSESRCDDANKSIHNLDSVRQMAAIALMNACRDGSLLQAFQQRQPRSTLVASAPSQAASGNTEASREIGSQTLTKKCMDSMLEIVLSDRMEADNKEFTSGQVPEKGPRKRNIEINQGSPARPLTPGASIAENAHEVAEDIKSMRRDAELELISMRGYVQRAKNEMRETYGDVKKEITDLRLSASETQKEFHQLRQSAQMVKSLLERTRKA